MAQPPVTQEQLLTLLDKAIDLYQLCQPIKGMLPSSQTLQTVLHSCGLEIELSYVKMCREIVIDARSLGE